MLAAGGGLALSRHRSSGGAPAPAVEKGQIKPRSATPAAAPPPTFNKELYSTSQPGSLWLIVNKNRPLPTTFVPQKLTMPAIPRQQPAGSQQNLLDERAAAALEQLFHAASLSGIELALNSGYRSAELQAQLFNAYAARDGEAAAQTYSARPGFSEHQTGLAADIVARSGRCSLEACFRDTAEGRWLADHGAEFGFIIRYPEGKQAATGYQFEPWHIRYVGRELAAETVKTGRSLEEFFGL